VGPAEHSLLRMSREDILSDRGTADTIHHHHRPYLRRPYLQGHLAVCLNVWPITGPSGCVLPVRRNLHRIESNNTRDVTVLRIV